MRATQDDRGRWVAMDGDQVVGGPFDSHAQAWSWIDRHTPEAEADDETHGRIGRAIGQW